MAKTQKYYRLGQRLPRYTTKLNAFANGMYLTKQTIPEGYVKAMINYDIDDTGSNIKPRRGRTVKQIINYSSEELGPVSFTDYIYSYLPNKNEIDDTKDVVISLGKYSKMSDLIDNTTQLSYDNPIYIGDFLRTVDTNIYEYNENTGRYDVVEAGEIYRSDLKDFWALYYDKDEETFKKVTNKNIGYTSARTIKNAYAFDKQFVGDVGRPVYTVLTNELIAFAGPIPSYVKYTASSERNTLTNFNKPDLCKLIPRNNAGGSVTIERKIMTPRVLNSIEASNSGYNILSENPYTFENEMGGSLAVLGLLMYDTNNHDIPVFQARLGNSFSLYVNYQYPSTHPTIKYKVEILNLTNSNSDWEVLTNFTNSFTAGADFYYDMVAKYNQFAVRVTLREGDDTTTESPGYRIIVCGNSAYDDLELKEFDLSTCKGMISWQGCIGVYGISNAVDTLFFSDVEDPSYFPFPNNVLTFDNEILAVHNYLDNLIVVTVDSIYLVTPGTVINTSTQKKILTNLNIPEIDAINLVVLKDQIFFKTDTSFYVLKPNQYTSDATDLKNYLNSTAIANYTKNFTEETIELLNKEYVLTWQRLTLERRKQIRFEDFKVYDTLSIVREDEVHYIYKIKPILTDNIELDYVDLHLVYNTLTRSWRMYLVAIGDDEVFYAPRLYRNKQSGAFYEFIPHRTSNTTSNLVVAEQTYDVVTDDLIDGSWHLTEEYNNYPYIDTGNTPLDDAFTKRFREVQFALLNMEHTTIKFYVDFILDGQERVHATKYELQHITDEEDPDYGKIWITPIEYTNMNLYGETALAEEETEDTYWSLDLSKFPDLNTVTVRFQLQGRGRRGAIQLLNTTLQRYELADLNWVYRIMNAR